MNFRFLKITLFSLLFIILISCSDDQKVAPSVLDTSPTLWGKVKANAAPNLLLTSEYNTPARLSSIGTLAWEDGLYISDDGLYIFAFYAPMDLLEFVLYSDSYGACPPVSPYIRGSLLNGMDLDTEAPIDNLGGCTQGVMHSDIAYASRSSVNESFSSWTRHSVSNPTVSNPALFYYEGGLSASSRSTGNYDIVFSRSTFDNNKNDLYWVQDVTSLTPASPTINKITDLSTANQEDNPHLERPVSGDDSKLILLYDNHGDSSATDYIMSYSISSDGGLSWDAAQTLGASINNSTGFRDENIQGHLFKDALNEWWLYFSSNRDGAIEIWRSKHNDSPNIFTDLNNWAAAEKVIALGSVSGNYGTIAGLGEPTLTANGDLYFAVVYCKNAEDQSSTDSCDIDPWVTWRK